MKMMGMSLKPKKIYWKNKKKKKHACVIYVQQIKTMFLLMSVCVCVSASKKMNQPTNFNESHSYKQ